MSRTETLAVIASMMMLTPTQAVALPATVTNAAGKVNMTEDEFIAQMKRNGALRDYIASVCRKVMS